MGRLSRAHAWLTRAGTILIVAPGLVFGFAAAFEPTPAAAPSQESTLPRPASGPGLAPAFLRTAVPTPDAPASTTAHWPRISASPGGVHRSLRVPILMYHRIVGPALAGRSRPELVVPPR